MTKRKSRRKKLKETSVLRTWGLSRSGNLIETTYHVAFVPEDFKFSKQSTLKKQRYYDVLLAPEPLAGESTQDWLIRRNKAEALLEKWTKKLNHLVRIGRVKQKITSKLRGRRIELQDSLMDGVYKYMSQMDMTYFNSRAERWAGAEHLEFRERTLMAGIPTEWLLIPAVRQKVLTELLKSKEIDRPMEYLADLVRDLRDERAMKDLEEKI